MIRKETIFAILILSVITCAFFYQAIFSGRVMIAADVLGQYLPWKLNTIYLDRPHNPEIADTVDAVYPMKYYGHKMIKQGIMPLWDTSILCGVPFLANNESLLFNPIYSLFYLFSLPESFGYANMLQIFLAGLFMYLFMRSINVGMFGALLSGIVYMFNGFFIVWLEDLTFVSPAVWLPLILLSIEKSLRAEKPAYSILAGFLIGIQFLCGIAQVCFYLLICVFFYACIRLIQLKPKKILVSFRRILLIFIIGFGLGAIQLIPTFELVNLCQRQELKYAFHFFDLSVALHTITFVFPNMFGSPMNYSYWGLENYTELCGYMGILPLILVFIALLYRRDWRVWVFFIIWLFALLIYLDTPLNCLLYLVPGYSKAAANSRFIFLYLFCGSILAGLGADYLEFNTQIKLKLKPLSRRIFFTLAAIIGIIFISILVFKVYGQTIIRLISHIPFCNSSYSLTIFETIFTEINTARHFYKYYNLISQGLFFPILLILSSLWLLRLYAKRGPVLAFKVIVILIVIADLFFFGLSYLTFTDKKQVFPRLESTDFLKKDKDLFRVLPIGNAFPRSTIVPYDFQLATGYLSLPVKRYAELCLKMDKKSGIEGGVGIEFLSFSAIHSPLINLLNAKYILTDKTIDDNKFKLVYDKDVFIYENKNVLPRVFIVPYAKVIKKDEDILNQLNSDSFNPLEYVILEEEPVIKPVIFSLKDSTVRIIDYSANGVKIEANLTGQGFLVFLDTDYPGWKVYVDGKKDRIYRANYIFRAVQLDKGKHLIKFIFRPFSFIIGLTITIVTLIAALTGIFLSTGKRKNRN